MPQDSALEAVSHINAQSTDGIWFDEVGTGTFGQDVSDAALAGDSLDEDDSLTDVSLDEEHSNDGISADTFEQEDIGMVTTDITTTTNTLCEASCTLYAPRISVVSWIPEEQVVDTVNVTVGIITTFVFLCNDITVATRLHTEYHWDSAPAGKYPPHLTTNGRDNAVAVVPFTDAAITSVVELVYPNSHIAYDTIVSWQGIVKDYDDLGELLCVTVTDEPSTVHLTSYVPIPRSSYPEPTASRRNRLNISLGQSFRPQWVPLDSQPPDSIIEQPIYEGDFPIAITNCQKAAILDLRPSVFYGPRYIFDYKTLWIELDATGMGNTRTSSGRWRNSTGSGAICMGFAQQFAELCERPEIPSSSDECVHTITIWNDTIPTVPSITYGDADRFGPPYQYTPQSATGFETVYNTESIVTPFLYAGSDWIVDGKGGIVTPPGLQAIPVYRNPDASEAAAILDFLKSHTEELRVGSWKPEQTQPPTRGAEGLKPINAEAVSKYFKEPLEHPAQPSGDGTKPSDRHKAPGLEAIGSAFNSIFVQGTPTNCPHSETASTLR